MAMASIATTYGNGECASEHDDRADMHGFRDNEDIQAHRRSDHSRLC